MMKHPWRWLGVVMLLAMLLPAMACTMLQVATPTPTMTLVPTSTATPRPTDTPSPTPTRGLAMPASSTLLEERLVDLDEDGLVEKIVTFRADTGDGLAIDDWQFMLPEGQIVERLQTKVLAVGEPESVLLYTAAVADYWQYLYIWQRAGDEYVTLTLQDGPLDGETRFRSVYYQPVVDDGDFNGTEEIAVCWPADNPDYVEVVYYDWDEMAKAYRYSTLFIAQPLHAPVTATPAG